MRLQRWRWHPAAAAGPAGAAAPVHSPALQAEQAHSKHRLAARALGTSLPVPYVRAGVVVRRQRPWLAAPSAVVGYGYAEAVDGHVT